MVGAGFLLAINLSVAALFAAAFLLICVREPDNVAARWFAAMCPIGVAHYVAEWGIPSFDDPFLLALSAFSLSLAALLCIAAGLAERYRRRWLLPVLAGVLIFSLAAFPFIYGLPRASLVRQFAYQAPYVIAMAIAAAIVLSARERGKLDTALGLMLAIGALHFLTKPLIAGMVGGIGATPQDYVTTTYALYSQAIAAVLIVALGLMLLGVLIRDMLTKITEQSETDTLSGLLNRRGFEERAMAMIDAMTRAGLPVSVVIADLDHFKEINDTHGHATGDRVIAGFAKILREATAEPHIVGRIGGEEFAVLLPGVDQGSARLFAEGVRNAYSYLPIEGIGAGWKLSASFGVASLMPGERLNELLLRGDRALYQAKDAGRNCVRLADGAPRLAYRGGTAAASPDDGVVRR